MSAGGSRHYLIGSAVVAALVVSYTAAGFLGVPHFARSGLQSFVSSHYGRALSMGEIRFNPFTFALEVSRFSLPDADGEPMLSFARLRVELEVASLWRRAPSFREIVLERPFVRTVIRADGALNLADLTKGFAGGEQAKPVPNSKPTRLFIDRLAVLDGSTTFEDRTHPAPFLAELKPIAFELRDFSTTAKTDNAYALSAASPEGERLHWNGTVSMTPLSSRGRFEIADLRARTVWNYLHEPMALDISSGIIGLKGDYDLSAGSAALGIKVNVRETTVTDLGLKPRAGAADYVDLARIEVRDTRVDVGRRAVEVGQVRVAGGEVRAWLDSHGTLNLLELTAASDASAPHTAVANGGAVNGAAAPVQPSPSAAAVPDGAQKSGWSLAVPDIAVDGLKIFTEDRQVKPAVALVFDPFSAHVTGFRTAPGTRLDAAVESAINGGGKVKVTAQYSPGSGALVGRAELAGLDLTAFQPYITQRTALTLLDGQLATKLDIERRADGGIAIKADTEVAGLRTVDNELKQDFIKWKQLRIAGLQYNSQPASLRIGSIVAREPYARVIIAPDQSVNVAEVLGVPSRAPQANSHAIAHSSDASPSDSPPASPESQARTRASGTPATPVSIASVRILNGSANYADLWIQPHFAVGIQGLNGTVIGLASNPRSRAKVELDGKVDRYAPVHIAGDVNLLAPSAYTDIKMNFKGLELTTMTPYSGHFAGYKIDKGKLSVDLGYQVEHRKLTAEHRFVIDQLQLGERVESPDAVNLPLRLAVALLKDRNGVIDIGLPISGTLDDPQFRLGPIIWKAFVNLLTKVVTAPFALLGHLFGGGEEMNFIDFAGGSGELDATAKEKLAALVKALKARPQLQLDLPITFSPQLDRPSLAAMRLHEQLLALERTEQRGKNRAGGTADEAILANPAEHLRLLVAKYRSDLGKGAQLPASAVAVEAARKNKVTPPFEPAISDLETELTGHIEVPDAELQQLGRQRAQAIRDVLFSDPEIDASRVFVINAAPKAGSGDKVRVEMSLK